MTRRFPWCALAVLLALPGPARAQLPEEVTVGTTEGVERLPLSVDRLLGDEQAGGLVRKVVLDDLAVSGLFDLRADVPGVRYRLTGLAERDGEQVVVTVSLEEAPDARVLMARRLRGGEASLRRVGHRVADEIVEIFTGREGPFDSRIAFVSGRGERRDVHVMDWDGENVSRVTRDGALVLSPEVSSDGGQMLFTSYVEGFPSVYLVQRRTGEIRRLFSREGLNQSPAFGPDQRTLAFSATFDGNSEIYLANVDGSSVRRLTDHPAIEVSPAWSPTGREIAFVSDRTGTPQVHVMTAEGLDVRRLTFEGSYNAEPAYSPDGTRLAFSSRREGVFQVCVLDLATGGVQVVTSGRANHESPTWSPDGELLAYASDRTGDYDVWIARRDGSGARRVGPPGVNRFPYWYR
jgi:TolB protein